MNCGRVLAVVSFGDELVTNQQAIDLGGEVLRRIFSRTMLDPLEPFNVITLFTRSFCHIDFTVRGCEWPEA